MSIEVEKDRLEWSGVEDVVVLLAVAGKEDVSAFVCKREALAYLEKLRGQRVQTPSKSEEV
jgi:hypothetical protein